LPLPDLLEALGRSNEEEIAKVVSAAREEAECILGAARVLAEERLGRLLDDERARLRQASERRRVTGRRAAAARLLRARAAVLERVFAAASAAAPRVLGWPEYAASLEADVHRIRELLGGDPGILRCAPADAGRVRGWTSGSALAVVPAPEIPAGLHCTADEGRLTVDLTLPSRLAQERPVLAIGIGSELEVLA
jgi:vacuolar-type H+-ATPase subunit E/Vma4